MTFELNRRGLLLGLSAAALAGCTTPPPSPRFPQLTFTHLPPFRLDVQTLDIVDSPHMINRADVAPGMPVPPAVAARQWANDRLMPVGTSGSVTFTITEASVIEVPLERTPGVRGVVTNDQSERYNGKLAAKINIANPARQLTGEVSAEATRSRTVPENLTLNERDMIWFEMSETLINDLNTELEKAINQFLQPFLIR
jgi:hypothetical protein